MKAQVWFNTSLTILIFYEDFICKEVTELQLKRFIRFINQWFHYSILSQQLAEHHQQVTDSYECLQERFKCKYLNMI